jgi:hypothetical protein
MSELPQIISGDTLEMQEAKRGRKIKSTNYFDVQEEDAVKEFLLADTIEERNKIYNEFLKKPIEKMVSSIIRRYKLFRPA